MRPPKTAIQRRSGNGIDKEKAEHDNKLALMDVGVISSIAVGGLGLLIILSFWLAAGRIPFIVGAAVPLFTLLAIIYQAIVYRRQWHSMEQAQRQTDAVIEKMQSQIVAINNQTEIMSKSLVASEKMVAHSEKNITVTQEGIEHAQRAYLTVTQCIAGPAGFKLTIENSGNTPAREVAVNAITEPGFGNIEMPAETGNYRPVGLLGPRSPVHVFFAIRNLTSEEEGYYNDSEWGFHWFCRGQIFYRDIFQREGDYWIVDFCLYLDQLSGDVIPDSSGNEIKRYRDDRQVTEPTS